MPFVNIRIVKEVIADDPAGKKRAIAGAVQKAIAEATGIGPSDIRIVFEELTAEDWYVGKTSVSALRAASSSSDGPA